MSVLRTLPPPLAAVQSGLLPALVVVLPLMMRLSGSSSQVPASPCGAEASSEPVMFRVILPEVSTNPPLPPFGPPLASMLPPNCVQSSAQTVTLPPLPLFVALALIVVFACTMVCSTVGVVPSP